MTTVVIFFCGRRGVEPRQQERTFRELATLFLLPMTASRSGRTLPYPRRTSLPAGPSHINQSCYTVDGVAERGVEPRELLWYQCPGLPSPVNLRLSRSDRHGVTGDCYDLVVLRPVGRYGARGSISALLDDDETHLTLRTFPGLGAHHCACLASNTLCCSICFRPWLYTGQTQARRR